MMIPSVVTPKPARIAGVVGACVAWGAVAWALTAVVTSPLRFLAGSRGVCSSATSRAWKERIMQRL